MKLKSKLMAAAIALFAASGANAAVTLSATGNGELFFTIYDIGADASSTSDDRAYVRDLGSLVNGGTLNSWASTAATPVLAADKIAPGASGTIFSIAADTALTSFLTASTDNSRLRWNIAALDSSGADRFLTTAASISPAQTPNYNVFRGFGSNGGDVYLAAVNPALTGQSANFEGAAASISKWGNNVGGKALFDTTAGLGQSAGFFLLSETVATGATTTLATVQQFMGVSSAAAWTLSETGVLTYDVPVAAIPEPSEYALMLAGLAMLGFMARRRLNNRV